MLMSGISAAFSALFGTPMAAAFLAMEIASIGIMYYAALVPCLWASLTAYMLAKAFHAPFENLAISSDVTLNLGGSARVILLAVLCAFVSILFCKPCGIKILYARFSEPVCSRIYRRCHYYPAFLYHQIYSSWFIFWSWIYLNILLFIVYSNSVIHVPASVMIFSSV